MRSAKIVDIGSFMAAFANLSSEERERSLRLIKAYNEAVFETYPSSSRGNTARQLFDWNEIGHLVSDYREDRLSNIGPAMERYLSLLERGYRQPNLE